MEYEMNEINGIMEYEMNGIMEYEMELNNGI
jgi:hypothetical protein